MISPNSKRGLNQKVIFFIMIIEVHAFVTSYLVIKLLKVVSVKQKKF